MKNGKIEYLQKKIISFVSKHKKNKYNQFSDINYLNTWVLNFGNYFLRKKFLDLSFFDNLNFLFFLFYKKNISENYNFYFNFSSKNILKNIYQNLVISFKSNYSDFDTHFSSNRSYTKNSLWLLINLTDKNFFEKSENIIISKKKINNVLFIKFKTTILFLIWLIFGSKNHEDKNFISTFNRIFDRVNLRHIKRVFLPYEAQPYQKYLINLIKKKNRKCEIIAYCHGGLPSLPIEYTQNKLIDKIYVHSKVEQSILTKFFGWKKTKIFLTKSFRHFKKNKIKPNKLYLPYNFNFNKKLKEDLHFLFSRYDMGRIKVVSHPFVKNSRNQKKLHNYIHHLKQKKNSKYDKKNTKTIFLGVTGSILEALQNGLNVIHVTNNPQFELYSNFLWKNIKVTQISERIFSYKLEKKNNLIFFSKKNFFIKKNKL